VTWVSLDEATNLHAARYFGEVGAFATTKLYPQWTRFVQTGPTLLLPNGIVAVLFGDVNIPFSRVYVMALQIGLFILACRVLAIRGATSRVVAALLILWIACMPCDFGRCLGSIELLTRTLGEGTTLELIVLTCALAANSEPRYSSWAWIVAMLAMSTKAISVLLLMPPLGFIFWNALRKRKLALLGIRGLLAALVLPVGWEGFKFFAMGSAAYSKAWMEFFKEVGWGGFFKMESVMPGQHMTPLTRLLFLDRYVYAGNSWVVAGLYSLSALGAFWLFRSKAIALFNEYEKRFLAIASLSVICLSSWFFIFPGYPAMRYLWNAYALLGWLVAFCVALLFARRPAKTTVPVLVTVALLAVATSAEGSLRALAQGLFDESWSWSVQEAAAQELSTRFPRARFFYNKWEFIPVPAFFANRMSYPLEEFQPTADDLYVCDSRGSGCALLHRSCKRQALPPSSFQFCGFPLKAH
jgi:hypothetical protein